MPGPLQHLHCDHSSDDDDFAVAPRGGAEDTEAHEPAGPGPAVQARGRAASAGSTVINLLESDEDEDE